MARRVCEEFLSFDSFKFSWRFVMSQHLFNFSNCPSGIQVFWTRFGAVHNCVTFKHGVRIVHLLKSLRLQIEMLE